MFYTLNFNIYIIGNSQLTWPSYGPPSYVSNHAIPNSVYLLNANLQPQLELVRFWCISCLVAFNT
jgi:hypothetical protein